MTDHIVLVSAARTPIGAFNGALKSVPASELGATALRAAIERAGLAPDDIDEVVLGHVLTAGAGMNPARQASVAAGIGVDKTALTINQVCGSGLRAVALACNAIKAGDARIVAAGGQESMSRSPHAAHLRDGTKMGELALVDTMIRDGLWDAFHDYHMGVTAENVAREFKIDRATQDALAARSQANAEAAQKAGRFGAEIVPVEVPGRKGSVTVDTDEYPRHGTTAETLAGLRTVFDREGTVTAGNASGINDGAAAVIAMSAGEAERRGVEPLARVVSWATRGVDPRLMGSGPIPASRAALALADWRVDSLDLVEANEAFAAQACAVNNELGWDPEIVNVNGGAIALGHPIGASGARILVTLLHELRRRGGGRGLATLCIGGGMGIALCVETV